MTAPSSEQAPPTSTLDGQTTGTVRTWNDQQGWGVIDSPQTPGGCWAHFSHIVAEGFRTVPVGAAVILSWQQVTDKDGYRTAPPASSNSTPDWQTGVVRWRYAQLCERPSIRVTGSHVERAPTQ